LKKLQPLSVLLFALLLIALPLPALHAATPPPQSWPKVYDRNGVHLIVYQPQLRSWRNFRSLTADTAISVTQPGAQPVLGVISWRATTVANVAAGSVFIRDIQVISSRFPSVPPAQEAALQQRFAEVYPTLTFTISLQRMVASLEKLNEPVKSISANPQPPPIYVSNSPAILLLVEGKPVLAPISGTTLKYVVNTNWDLFRDTASYYLLDGKTWLRSKELSGPWTATTTLPPAFSHLPAGQNWDDVIKSIPPSSAAKASFPKVVFTDKPAELIVFKGAPVYAPIPGTALQYATNTDSSVFLQPSTNETYLLVSGRWFRASSLKGPWAFASKNLPADFARIPSGHPYSSVLVSVPGTQAASDAVLLSQVPTTAVVDRAQAEAHVKVAYAGEPQFLPIESTTLFYAVNTPDRVIRVDNSYYLCYQAIWFVSNSPSGPWKTADFVPAVIYTIPPSSPVYNVTYVTVSNPTVTTVEMSYSSGYMGMFVLGMAVGSTVVYGTGYYYPPYVYWGPHYPIYYPYPYTYGAAAIYNPYTGAYAVGRAVYGPYGSAGTAAWYNPNTGMYGRAVTTQNAYGGHTYAQAYNPWTGTYAQTSQGHNQYSQWGSSVVTNGDNWAQAQHVTNANGTAGSFQTSKGSAGAGFNGANGNSGFVAKDANNNNVYAGVDGNVYKKDSDGNWSKYDDGSWTPVDKSTAEANAQTKAQDKSQDKSQTKSQNLDGSRKSTTPGANDNSPGSAAGNGKTPDPSQRGQRAQNPPTQTAPSTGSGGLGSANGSGGVMGQLNNDAGSRDRGSQLEQGSRSGGLGSGNGGGGRRRR
jgi:hypothetical protein